MSEFINLRYVSMSVKEYSLRFAKLSKYAPSIVADCRTKMSIFVSRVLALVVNEYHTTMLVHDMDIARLMIFAQHIEEAKLKWKVPFKDKKRCRLGDYNFLYDGFDRHGRSRNLQRSFGKGSE